MQRLVNKLAKLFRIVVYTSLSTKNADKIVESIDPNNMISERLYKRDLSKNPEVISNEIKSLSKDNDRFLLLDFKENEEVYKENYLRIPEFNFSSGKEDSLNALVCLLKERVSEIRHNIDLREVVAEHNKKNN